MLEEISVPLLLPVGRHQELQELGTGDRSGLADVVRQAVEEYIDKHKAYSAGTRQVTMALPVDHYQKLKVLGRRMAEVKGRRPKTAADSVRQAVKEYIAKYGGYLLGE